MTDQRTDASFAALLLVQRLVPASVEPLKASEYWDLLERVSAIEVILGHDEPAALARVSGLRGEVALRVARLVGASSAVAFELERLERTGMRVVTSLDEDYPSRFAARLGRSAPPLLHVVGDPALLERPLLGVVGSRNVGPAGADIAREAVQLAAAEGLGVVTGAADGVDQVAMRAALDVDAPVAGVLADSLVRATQDPVVRRAITDGRLCLCTPYKPTAGFTVANAMGRNKLVYALSDATLVIAADAERGGTWAGAVEAMRRRIAPVLAWMGDGGADGNGNGKLVELGATALHRLSDLFPLPDLSAPLAAERQLSLDM